MALSLAACGGSSTTPAADLAAAQEALATAQAALTAANEAAAAAATASATELAAAVAAQEAAEAAQAAAEAALDAIENPTVVSQAFTLKSTRDVETAGAGDDTFSATTTTLTDGDKLDGGLGSDTLSIDDNLSVTAIAEDVSLTSIETVTIATRGNVGEVDGGSAAAAQVNTYVVPASTADVAQVNKYTFGTPNAASDVVGFTYGGNAGTFVTGATMGTSATAFASALNAVAGATIAVVPTAVVAANTDTVADKILTITDTTGIEVGDLVTGANLAASAGAVVVSISTNTVTLDVSAFTSTASNYTFTKPYVNVTAPEAGTTTPSIAFTSASDASDYPTQTLITGNTDGSEGDIVSFSYGGLQGSYTVGASAQLTAANAVTALNATISDATAAQVTVAGKVNGAVTASTNVTIDSNANISVGDIVTGTGISGTVTVASVTSATAIVLDTAVTISDNVDLTFATENVTLTADTAGTPLSTLVFDGEVANIPSGSLTTANAISDLTTAAALDVTALTTELVEITQADSANIEVAAGDDVSISGVTGDIKVDGGKDVTIVDKTGAVTVDNAAGAIDITSSANTADNIATTDGTDVNVSVTAIEQVGNVTIGTSGNEQSGAVTVTQTVTGSDADIANGGKTITVNGGLSAEVTVNNTITADEASDAGSTLLGSAIRVDNTDGEMLSLSVVQNSTATDSKDALTSAATVESAVVTFGAMSASETVHVHVGGATGAGTDFTFTAAVDLTAEQVASAFADLTAEATYGAAATSLGHYSGTLDAGYTSGSASGASVVFTATAAGAKSDIGVVHSGSDAAFTSTVTAGANEVVAEAAADVAVVAGSVTLNDNSTASVTSVTLEGYGDVDMKGTDFDALETLTLIDSANANIAEPNTSGYAPSTDGSGTAKEKTVYDFSDLVVTTAGDIAFSFNAETADAVALTVGMTGEEIAAAVVAGLNGTNVDGEAGNEVFSASGAVLTVTHGATGNETDDTIDATATTAVFAKDGDTAAKVEVDTASETLVLNLDNVNGVVDLDVGTATVNDLTINATGVKSAASVKANDVDTLVVNAAVDLDLSGDAISDASLLDVTVTGAGKVTFGDLTAAEALDSFDASENSGGISASVETATAKVDALTEYKLGSGDDSITALGADINVKVSLGAGDDTFTLASSTTTPTKVVDGGLGIDTLAMDDANAITSGLSGDTNFAAKITGFERLEITETIDASSADVTIDVEALGFDYVTTNGAKGANDAIIDNLASGGTVALDAAVTSSGEHIVKVKDASTGTEDVLNLVTNVVSSNVNVGSVTAADVEQISITANDTKVDDDADGEADDVELSTVTVVADTATTFTIGGNADVTVDGSSTAELVLFDASEATGVVTYTADGKSTGMTVEGGLGNDVFVAAGENDVIKGNSGDDTITLGDLTQAYGGAGNDTFLLALPSASGKISTIHDLSAGDTIVLEGSGAGGDDATKFYSSGAVYNDNTTDTFAEKLNVAATQTGEKEATWFQHGENTYIFIDDNDGNNIAAGAADTYVAGADTVVEIVGLFDLSDSTFTATGGELIIA